MSNRTSLVLRPSERRRIKKISADIERETGMRPTMQEVIYAALRECSQNRGLEQRADVEPQDRAGDTVPPGASS